MRGTGCRDNWVLLWWTGGCSVNLWSDFMLMGSAVLPPVYLFSLWQPSPGVFRLYGRTKGDLQKDSCQHVLLRTSAASTPVPMQDTAHQCLLKRPSNTHSQVWLSLSWGHCSFPLGPGAHKALFCPPRFSVSPNVHTSIFKIHNHLSPTV